MERGEAGGKTVFMALWKYKRHGKEASKMSEVVGPYHLLTLCRNGCISRKWAHLVSHDHPFENGFWSGRIKLTLRNESPLCVGGPREQGTNAVKWLRDPSGKPIIPGTSIKACCEMCLK